MRRLIGALSGAALIAVMATGAAFASHYISPDSSANLAPNSNSHMQVDGNPRCPAGQFFSNKIEAEDLGVGNYGPIRITYFDGKYVSWEIREAYLNTYDADVVIVKGGPTAMLYQYSASDRNPPDDWDTRLTAPRNPNGAGPKYYGISHIEFCFDPKAT